MYAIMLLAFGSFHFMNAEGMAGMVPSYMPGGVFWVYLVGVCLVLAALAIILHKMARTALYLTGFLLILFVLMVYVPQVAENEMAMGTLLRDFGLAGAAFFMGNHLKD